MFDAQPLLFRRLLTREVDKTPIRRSYLDVIASVYRPIPLTFSPDGSLLAVGAISGNVVVWDVASGMEKYHSPAGGQIVDLIFSSDGQVLISAGPDLLLRPMKNTGQASRVQLPLGAKATATAMSPDGSVLVVGLSTGEIAIFDATKLVLLYSSKVHEAPVTGLAFQRQGGIFASTAGGYDLRLWQRSLAGGFEKSDLPVAAATSAAGTFDKAQGGGLLLWLLGTIRGFQIVGAPTLGAPPLIGGSESKFAKAARTIPPHCGSQVAFSADGRYLASSANLMMCPDCIGTLAPAFLMFVTDLDSGTTTTVRDLGCDVAISPDGRTFTTGGPGAPQIRDSVTGQQLPRN
ncbi:MULTISPECIES: WD40 repeat domain-containing protein [Acidovorax]|uniref:WD40 repeat domain-containing protein n=1 Tax=Acidovorax TaxID=12916 RepID=UPI001114F428|nr:MULTISPECIES: WD40 repeat domain-containing protein [Acidovorax]